MDNTEFINMSQTLSIYTGIALKQANYILQESKIITKDNFSDWLDDIKRISRIKEMNNIATN